MVMKRYVVLALLSAGTLSCQNSFESDLRELRAEIQRMEREMPADEPLWITEGPNAFAPHIEDFTLGIPGFIHQHIARKLQKMKSTEVTSLVQGPLPVVRALREPDALRGRFWKATGTIGNLEPVQVDEGTFGTRTLYAGALYMDGSPVLFHVIEKGDVVTIGRDIVEIDGVFVKVLAYEARDGRRIEAPFLMARRVGRYF
jgi:hypothetical protein